MDLRPGDDEAGPAAAPGAYEVQLEPAWVPSEGEAAPLGESVHCPVVPGAGRVELPGVELRDGCYVRGYGAVAAAREAAGGPDDEAEAGAAAAPEGPGDAYGACWPEVEPPGECVYVAAPVQAVPVGPPGGDVEGGAEAGHGYGADEWVPPPDELVGDDPGPSVGPVAAPLCLAVDGPAPGVDPAAASS